ncbi:hypothetical protein [Gemmobacter serpentinus]|uniref:hypothetical protein n=1 Tax=Gemmobacter serpentinus TaxID=2652247 RepID=UPI00124C5A71|nr:hypothetical protein [Gemmobacter serpentinus]
MTEQSYIARAAGWIAGRRVKAGERLTMTPAAARYEPVDMAPQGAQTKRAARKSSSPIADAPADQGEAE